MESRKMVLKNPYLQDSNGETDLGDAGGGRRERVEQMERVTWKFTMPYVK